VKGSLIIERPKLQSRTRRTVSAVLSSIAWAAWFYLWLPLVTLGAWVLGVRLFDLHILRANERTYTLTLALYGVFILGIVLILKGWSFYNLKRYGARERRTAPSPVENRDLSKAFGAVPELVEAMQSAKTGVLYISEDGVPERLEEGMPGAALRTSGESESEPVSKLRWVDEPEGPATGLRHIEEPEESEEDAAPQEDGDDDAASGTGTTGGR
jgi:biofilm PGA synthesis protein PgaD